MNFSLRDTVVFDHLKEEKRIPSGRYTDAMETDRINDNNPPSPSSITNISPIFVSDVTWNTAGDSLAVAGSNGEIKVYHIESEIDCQATLALKFQSNPAFTDLGAGFNPVPSVTPAVRFDHHNPMLLWSCGEGGAVALWDLRTANVVSKFVMAKRPAPLLCLDVNADGNLVAAGSALVGEDAKILFWDIRTTKMMGQFTESHNDDITQVLFHPTDPNQIVSSSEDGLIGYFILRNQFDEDESIESVMNTNQTPSKIGFFGPENQWLYCTTNVQTFSVWNYFEAKKQKEYGDIRSLLAPNFQMDYIIDCQYDPTHNQLYMMAGTYGGDVEVFRVGDEITHGFSLKQGHIETIRSSSIHFQTEKLATVGEDSRLCIWSTKSPNTNEICKPRQEHHKQNFNPYKRN